MNNTRFMQTIRKLQAATGAQTEARVKTVQAQIEESGRATPMQHRFVQRFGKIDQKEPV
jgi:hypothetical protein